MQFLEKQQRDMFGKGNQGGATTATAGNSS